MLPPLVDAQKFINTGDLAWSIWVKTDGDCPPTGVFVAHMAKDPASLDIDKVFSEARGNLVRGASDTAQQRTLFTFRATTDEVKSFVGGYTVDMYYERAGGRSPVMRTSFEFSEGA